MAAKYSDCDEITEKLADISLKPSENAAEEISQSPPSQPEQTGTKKKKKKNRKKSAKVAAATNDEGQNNLKVKSVDIKEIIKAQQEESARQKWKFWNTQPVPKLDEKVEEVGKIEADKDKIKEDSYTLPAGFEWDTLDLKNSAQLKEVYELLTENYVEDEDNMFRFDYSAGFLQWALQPPGHFKEWHCGVRVVKNKKLVGFISGVPSKIKVYEQVENMVEINFLCVHKKLRAKRVAPVLIKEITRRVNLRGVFQAVYTAGIVLPKPIATCRYYHRSLNPKKLVDVQFSHIGRNQTMQRLIKLMRLPTDTQTKGLREMRKKDVAQCHTLYLDFVKKFNLTQLFTLEEFEHFFLPRPGIVQSYVVENAEGKLTDMSSFFSLPSSIMSHPDHSTLNAAYSFYTVHTETNITQLMKDMLIIAKQQGYDVFNALDLMDNRQFLKELKFGMGDGNLNYYLFNYKCPVIESEKVGLVLQ
ncbi:glycylpeptide N-tetradecanoyltransferase 2-like [Styela clava]